MSEPHQPDPERPDDESAVIESLIGHFADELREIPQTADFAEESAALIESYLTQSCESQWVCAETHDAVELRRTLIAIATLEQEGRRRQAGSVEPAGTGVGAEPAGARAGVEPGRVAFFFPGGEGVSMSSIRGFRILREIGRGGMGIVFEAKQIVLRRRVAVKILPMRDSSKEDDTELPSLGITEPGAAKNPGGMMRAGEVDGAVRVLATKSPWNVAPGDETSGAAPQSETGLPELSAANETPSSRFMREARIIARLHHTNIVPVLEAGCEHGLHWYAMQLIRGRSLDHLVRAVRENDTAVMTEYGIPAPYTPAYFRRVCEFFLQVTDALAHVHHRGLLHRDIKPGNLILEPNGRLWVTDFGLARVRKPDREHENENPVSGGPPSSASMKTPVGTLRYMAPEQLRGEVTTQSDLYAVGLTLYEMFGLHAAFRETNRARLTAQVERGEPSEPLGTLAPELPTDLVKITEKAICPDPAGRYPTAEAMTDDLRRYLEGRPVHAHPISAWQKFLRWRQRSPWIYYPLLTALTAVIAVVIVGWSGWLITRTALDNEAFQRGQAEQNLELSVRERMLAQEQRDRAEWNLSLSLDILDEALPSLSTRRAFAVYTIPSPDEREELETLLQFYEELTKANAKNSRLRLEMARTLSRIGTVRLTLGDPHSAMEVFEDSLGYYAQFAVASNTSTQSSASVASSEDTSTVASSVQPPSSNETTVSRDTASGTAASGTVAGDSVPGNESWRIDVARIHNELGYAKRFIAGTMAPGPDRAEVTMAACYEYCEALRILEQWKSPPAQLERIRSLNALGVLISVIQNMSDPMNAALDTVELAPGDAEVAGTVETVGTTESPGAMSLADSADASHAEVSADLENMLGVAINARSAESYHREAVAVATDLLKESSRPEYRFAKAQSQRLLVQTLRVQRSDADLAEIRALADDSTATLRRLITQSPEFAEYRKEFAQTLICQDLEQTTHEQLSEAERITNELVDHYPYVPEYRFLAAGVQARCGMKYFMEENISAGMEQMYEVALHVNRLKLDFPGLAESRAAWSGEPTTPSSERGRHLSIPAEIQPLLRYIDMLPLAGDPAELSTWMLPDTPITLSEVLQTLGYFHDFFRSVPASQASQTPLAPTSPDAASSTSLDTSTQPSEEASSLSKVADTLEKLTRWFVY